MAANAFEKHGIAHLSPSTCNLFLSSPAMFVLQKVLKKSTSVGAAAHRGTAVEEGIVHGLFNPQASVESCADLAKKKFRQLTALSGDPRTTKEGDAIGAMVIQGISLLRPYGKPTSAQGKIELTLDGVSVPYIGYYDVVWEQHGILIDIKTSHALPSKISVNHARQIALYRAATGDNMSARIAYITPKKAHALELENARQHLDSLAKIGKAIEKFLSVSDDPQELAAMTIPDVDSFYFNDPMTRQLAFEIWGV